MGVCYFLQTCPASASGKRSASTREFITVVSITLFNPSELSLSLGYKRLICSAFGGESNKALPSRLEGLLEGAVVRFDGAQTGGSRINEIEQAVETELADADFKRLGCFQATDVLREDLRQICLEAVDVPNAYDASAKE